LQTRLRTLTIEQSETLVDVALTSHSLAEFAERLPVATDPDHSAKEEVQELRAEVEDFKDRLQKTA
jgi:hypothetical protein